MHIKSAIILCALYFVTVTQQCDDIQKSFHNVASSLFEALDADKSGHITDTELQPVFKTLFKNVNDRSPKEILDQHDINRDNKVDSHEFVKMLYGAKNATDAQEATLADKVRDVADALFETLDKDNDNAITETEIEPVLSTLFIKDDDTPLTQVELLQLFKEHDHNGTGKTNKEEFGCIILTFYKIKK